MFIQEKYNYIGFQEKVRWKEASAEVGFMHLTENSGKLAKVVRELWADAL